MYIIVSNKIDNDLDDDLDDDFENTKHYYLYYIDCIPHIPKVCPNCSSDNLINDVVRVKTGSKKNKTESRHCFLCWDCEVLWIVTRKKTHFIIIEPILGNKLILRIFQLIQVSNAEFSKTDFVNQYYILIHLYKRMVLN